MECAICYETILAKDIKMIECNHAFHKSCLRKDFEFHLGKGSCPVCREPYTMRMTKSIVNKIKEIQDQNDKESFDHIREEDERYNADINDLCIRFQSLYEEISHVLPDDFDIKLLKEITMIKLSSLQR